MSIAPVKLASKMKLSQYNFSLPSSLIAQFPASNHEEARLLVMHRKTQKLEHKLLKDLPNYFSEDDLLVLNNTRVFPLRMHGRKEKTGANIEVFLLRELEEATFLWDALVDPARKIRIGNKIFFGEDELIAEVVDNTTSRGRTMRFLYDGTHEELTALLSRVGEMPIPKYIKRANQPEDTEYYNTAFSKHVGSIAPPYSGLNLTKILLKRMEIKGIKLAELTLHMGTGSFSQITVEDLSKHKSSAEQLIIPAPTADLVNQTRSIGREVCAVGLTTYRALEDRATADGNVIPCDSWTSRFIFPPYKSLVTTRLLTSFHMPKSMMMMTLSAFTGFELLSETYRKAIKERYRWGCYGDTMLVMD
jgi:S-adenosylmethionine:tRNA ribosyltransferase-isomerase